MKRYATVPMRCKFKRAIKSAGDSGFNCRTNMALSFSRKKGTEPAKTYHFGREYYISLLDIIRTVIAAVGAFALSVLFIKAFLNIKVGILARKSSKK